jgi:hypothetical protein
MGRSRILAAVLLMSLAMGAQAQDGAASRIIDGVNVTQATFPTVGKVYMLTTPTTFGTGVLVGTRYVLTAAHLISTTPTVAFPYDGRFVLNGITYNSKTITLHPTYTGSLGVEGEFDLAIIELAIPVPGATPSPVLSSPPTIGETLTLVGVGMLGTGATGYYVPLSYPDAGTLQTGATPLETLTPTFAKFIFDPAKNEANHSYNDDGGPVFVERNGVPTVCSIHSGGTHPLSSFGDTSVNTRVDVTTALTWINSIIVAVNPPPTTGPRPDMIIGALTLPASFDAGASASVTATVTNQGDATAGDFHVSIYLDQSSAVKSADGAAQSILVQNLLAGESRDLVFTVTYPNPGTYKMAVIADADNKLFEKNDLNNNFFQSVDVNAKGSDLLVNNIATTQTPAGINATFNVLVQNRGATAAGSFKVAFYNNRFTEPTAADTPDQTQTFASLGAGGFLNVTFALPTQSTARGGRAWFFVDQAGTVAEDIETNNVNSATWGVANTPVALNSPITATSTQTTVGQTNTFTVGASDANGDTLTYLWDFGDGTTLVGGGTVTHTYAAPGVYNVTVTIADGPFSNAESDFDLEVVSEEIVDLGTVTLSKGKARVKFKIPLPSPFVSKQDRVRSALISSTGGDKVKYRNLSLNGTAESAGVRQFVVEFQSKTRNVLKRVRYKYTVN